MTHSGRIRSIPQSFDPAVVAAIDARLAGVRETEAVQIPLAIESGSRAWGFPSPDSDYDCRFVFVRPLEQLLSPWLRRDVIETPLDAVLDVNGWELGKALKLLLKGNAVIIEWLQSPVVYDADEAFRDDFRAFASEAADPKLIARHYLHLGVRQRRVYFGDGTAVAQKKLFYALRPAAALRWLRMNPQATVPPMHFPTLMEECAPPAELRAVTQDLLARKAVTHELGTGPAPKEILSFIDAEFELATSTIDTGPVTVSEAARARATAFYQAVIQRS